MLLQDLLLQFEKVAERMRSEFKGLQTGGRLSQADEKTMRAIEKRP